MYRPSILLMAAIAAATALPAAAAPGTDTCARISVFDTAPRRQKLYPAVLIAIDGQLPGPTQGPTWRISPGPHTLTVAEAIEPHEFGSVQLRQRDGRDPRGHYKTLRIDARPGITYRLAAQFHREQRQHIADGTYWDPVVWKESPEPCR